MARGSSYADNSSLPPIPVTPQSIFPRRATRELPAIDNDEFETEVIPVRRAVRSASTYHYKKRSQFARLLRTGLWFIVGVLIMILLLLFLEQFNFDFSVLPNNLMLLDSNPLVDLGFKVIACIGTIIGIIIGLYPLVKKSPSHENSSK